MSNILIETVFGKDLKKKMPLEDAIQLIISKNLFDIGELAEQAISKKSGIDQCDKNTPGIDLVSGKQIKHAQTNPDHVNSYNLKAHITVRGITAPILAVVTERVTKQQYFFYVPYKAHKHLNGNTFCIPFETDGTPRRSNSWWKYEVDSFDKLCELAK